MAQQPSVNINDDRELFSRNELIESFSLAGIQKKGAVFDEKKLEWMNGHYLNEMSAGAFSELVLPYLVTSGFITAEQRGEARIEKIMCLLQPRLKKLSEIGPMTGYFFSDPENYDEKGVSKHWQNRDATIAQLEMLRKRLSRIEPFNTAGIEKVMRELAEELHISAGKLIHPLRLALTGMTFTPGIFEVLEVLGKVAVNRRIGKAIDFLVVDKAPS
jgi:glutamyl-tRNA synthetase